MLLFKNKKFSLKFTMLHFIGFAGPKLYTLYAVQIHKNIECVKVWIMEIWGCCSHKKIFATSVVTTFWNLTLIKTYIFAGNFVEPSYCCIMLLYHAMVVFMDNDYVWWSLDATYSNCHGHIRNCWMIWSCVVIKIRCQN